jgi:hypothetical protein
MCLTYSKRATDKYYEKIRNFIKSGTKRLIPPFRDGTYHPGYFKSDSRMKSFYERKNTPYTIRRGIHVYLNAKDARELAEGLTTGWTPCKVLKVRVHPEDLLGVSNEGTAVFKQVYFFKKDFTES